jgi:hypothetical protein
MHREKTTPMYGLQAIADIGQRSPDDNTHRVVDIISGHFLFDVYIVKKARIN